MRTIISISLPKELSKVVEAAVKHDKCATKSEFFRNLVRRWHEEKVVKEFRKNRKNFEAGKAGTLLWSLKDLQ